MEPRAVGSGAGGAVGKEDAAFVPAGIRLSDGGEVDGALAQGRAGWQEVDTLLVALSG